MRTYGQRVADKTTEWLNGPGAKSYQGSADGQYLTNRLTLAFQAGVEAGRDITFQMLAERDREIVR